MTRLMHHCLNLLFVPECAFCQVELAEDDQSSGGGMLCPTCREQFTPATGPRCASCGEQMAVASSDGRCAACRGKRFAFERVIPLGDYDDDLRRAVLRIKQVGEETLSGTLAELLWQSASAELTALKADVVAPVPMHWRRRMVRGVNSPEMIAEVLGRRLQLPVAQRLLIRRRNTLPQTDLPPGERMGNVKGAFRPGAGYLLSDAHVLLVDDILTTGATCSEASRTLRKSGAAQVSVAVLARA